jgi:2-amino-4-hydroxy-6-hydroxymethyldihydropteridine diphosphokinase
MTAVFVAAGGNIAPLEKLQLAAAELRAAFPDSRFSPWYQNKAAGFTGEDFVNFVVGFSTQDPVEHVLAVLHRIESLCGRARDAPRWAPRAMDLDILLFGDLIRNEARLVLPRPDLLKRAYMLGPLADIAPEYIHPLAGLSIAELWRRFDQAEHPLHRLPMP